MNPNVRISEELAVIAAAIPANSTAGGTITSTLVNIVENSGTINPFHRLLVLANATCTNLYTINLLSNTANSATSATIVASNTISAANVAAGILAFEGDVNAFSQGLNDTSNTYIGAQLVATTGTLTGGVVLCGAAATYMPASNYTASSVKVANLVT